MKSAVLPVEVRSALRRRVAEKTLDAKRVPGILKRLAADRAYWTIIEVSREVLAMAEFFERRTSTARTRCHPRRVSETVRRSNGLRDPSRCSPRKSTDPRWRRGGESDGVRSGLGWAEIGGRIKIPRAHGA